MKNLKRREVIEKRSANTKVFENQDHSLTTEIYLEPVHFQEDDGSWKDMDDSLEEEDAQTMQSSQDARAQDEKAYVNKKGKLKIHFFKQAKEQGTVRMDKDKYRLTWALEGVNKTKAQQISAKEIAYPEILKGVEARYRTIGEKVKENLVLSGKDAVHSFTYLYQLKGLHASQTGNTIAFLNDDKEEVFTLLAPYMKDAAQNLSEAIEITLEEGKKKGEYRITITPDAQWLQASERQYPVVIDPVVTTSKKADDIYDAHVDSLNSKTNYQYGTFLKTMGGDNIQRSYIKFQLPDIKSADMVVNARLVMVSLAEDGQERTIQVHKVLQDWNSASITWNNRPVYEEKIQDLCKYTGNEQKYVNLDITNLVKDWYLNGGNYGMMIKDPDELSGYTQFLASDCHDGYQNMRPRIDISYVNYSGLEDYWTYHSQSVGRAGDIYVNDYNGNLILVHPTLQMEGSRMPVTLSHVYNTNDRTVNLGYGYGFRLSYHQTMKKVVISDTDYYQYVDGDGTVHYFYYDEEKKKWKDESGLELTLTIGTGDTAAFTLKDKEDNQMVFNKAGYLVKVQDRNNNQLNIVYTDNRITKITDGAGRVTTLTYLKNSEGKLTYLSQIASPSGQVKKFTYTSGNLTAITDIDGEKMTYTYDGSRMLTSAVNVDGYKVTYTYYNLKPYRVKKITEYGGTLEGKSLQLAYGYNSTKFTDNKGRSEIYRFNNGGNLLHIHDGFGHAASGRYNRDGNHVNLLENATKLQDNIVQLLKDPIIQAKTIGWEGKVSDNTVTAGINTNTGYVKTGTRSLQLTSTDVTGSGYWAQSVRVNPGETYTLSMYVRAVVEQAGTNGRCFIRALYHDKDGNNKLADSEAITKSTSGFVQLKSTFTVPADAKDNVVRVSLYMYHIKGQYYGDMAQLEPGSTPNRCNLVENGDFHLGTTTGFSKTGKPEDQLTAIGTQEYIPVQSALLVTAASADIYSGPGTTYTKTATVYSGNHLASMCFLTGTDNGLWYRVKTQGGQTGYIHSASVIPYVAGESGLNTGAAAVTNPTLRADAGDSAAPVLYYIPKGTYLVLQSTKQDSTNKNWYRVGLHVGNNRYHGYLPADDVIRLSRNDSYGKMKAADTYYREPSLTSTAAGTAAKDSIVLIRGLVQKSNGEKWYAVLQGMEFCFLPERNLELVVSPIVSKLIRETITERIGGLEEHIFKFMGDPTMDKKLTKTLDLTGKKGDTYMVNAWGRGDALPETDNEKGRRFGVEVIFTGADGKTDVHYTNFSPDILDWQFLSDVYVAKQDYTSIKVSYTYCRNANMAFFDGLSLFREEFGQTYTYDSENNLISVVDAQKKARKFEYNAANDMTGVVDAKGNKFTYEYDSKHNVTKGTSAENVIYKLEYDSFGNVTKSGTVSRSNAEIGTWTTRTFTTDSNHIRTVTDARNNTVTYQWDKPKDLLIKLTDAKGNVINYSYDNANRLTALAQQVTVNGVKKEIKNSYTYTKDRITGISHNGFQYGFAYDAFGNTKNASIAGTQVISYEYDSKNGNLKKTLYGNGDYIRYTYDDMDRMALSYYYSKASGKEVKLHEYVYDKQGNLEQVTAHMAGKTYRMSYDFLNRLMRVTDEQGNSYQYTYDAENNMTRMYHSAGPSHIYTDYTYDKDGREVTAKPHGHTRTTAYDALGRVSSQTWNTTAEYKTAYSYFNVGNNRYSLPRVILNGTERLDYDYDGNGNIISIKDSAGTSTYAYDELNQLIRENNHVLNKTITYSYDEGGNLHTIKEYAFTTAEALPTAPAKTITGVYDTVWKDKLVNWNGTAMTYDAIGNMLTKGDTTYTWTQGRKLAGVNNGKAIQYFYDHTGMRTKKTVDGVSTEYRMAGKLIVSEKTNGATIWYNYDSDARLISLTVGGVDYFYIRNVQGDVIGLVDETGTEVVNYKYDSWGNLISMTGSLASTVGQKNPFRYKGYYYDTETGMYYLHNRYYVPEIRRFFCSDDLVVSMTALETYHNKNLYSYCNNNPLVRIDTDGKLWAALIGAVVGAATSIATQMIFEKKSFNELNWIDVGCSAVTMAVSATSLKRIGQAVVNGATACISSISREDKAGLVVMNTFIGAAFGFVGGPGGGYEDRLKLYNGHLETINELNYSFEWRTKQHFLERRIYVTDTKRTATYAGKVIAAQTSTNYVVQKVTESREKKEEPIRDYYIPCNPSGWAYSKNHRI